MQQGSSRVGTDTDVLSICSSVKVAVVSFCTYEVQDPAHGAVASAGQDSEVRNVSEEVQPAKRRQQRLLLLYFIFF